MKKEILEQVMYLMRYNSRFIRVTYRNTHIAEYPSDSEEEFNHTITEPYLMGRVLNCFGAGDWSILYNKGDLDLPIDVGIIGQDNTIEYAVYTDAVLTKLLNLRNNIQPILDKMDADFNYTYCDEIYCYKPTYYSIEAERRKTIEREKFTWRDTYAYHKGVPKWKCFLGYCFAKISTGDPLNDFGILVQYIGILVLIILGMYVLCV